MESNDGDLVSVKYPFIAIFPRSILIYWTSLWPTHGLNRAICMYLIGAQFPNLLA